MSVPFLGILESPLAMRRFNGWATVFWIIMIPISIATGWIALVTFLGAISLWALVAGHLGAWQSARVECKQQEDADVQEVLDVVKEKL